MSAITAGKSDIMKVVDEASEQLHTITRKNHSFIDEIHRSINLCRMHTRFACGRERHCHFYWSYDGKPIFEANEGTFVPCPHVYELEPLDHRGYQNSL